MKTLWATITALLLLVSSVEAAKVLIIPAPSISHCLEMMVIGQELLNRGHHVTLIAVYFDPKPCLARLDTERFESTFKIRSPYIHPDEMQELKAMEEKQMQHVIDGTNMIKFLLNNLFPLLTKFCRAVFYDADIIKELEREEYDFAIGEGLPFISCGLALPVHLGIPYASVSSHINWRESGTHLQSQTYPGFLMEYSSKMTFGQRFINTLVHFLTPVLFHFIVPAVDFSEFSTKLNGVDTSKLIKDSSLFIENTDYVFDYPKAVLPNFIQVGGLSVTPPRKLSKELHEYLEGAKDGVILVTFGSILKNIPEKVIQNTMFVLQRVKQRVLFKHKTDRVDGNVKMMTWIPQNDVLAHPNVKLFITHCGKNSIWEGIYNGVPLVCTPFGTDGWSNAAKVKTHRIGASVNIRESEPEEFLAVVQSTLADNTFRENVKRMSNILRSRPETPSERAASAIEHVINYGDAHIRSPLLDLNFLTVIYADFWITLLAIGICVVVVNVWICRKCCCRGKRNNKTKTD